jgi:predicted amidophosphoribosyltransferase
LLGRALAGLLGLPLLPSAVVRIRETGSQVGLQAGDRWANVDGAFAADPSLVRDQTVLLIDDVHTTGATLAACAYALGQAGARRVVGLTVARA